LADRYHDAVYGRAFFGRRRSVGLVRRIPTIGIVDDDDAIRGSTESFLRSAGFEVRGFGTAEDFLASPHRRETDCLITDLNMPGMDGLTLIRQLQAIGVAPPVIVITGYPTSLAQAQSAEFGAIVLLPKPVDPDELLHWVDVALKRDGC